MSARTQLLLPRSRFIVLRWILVVALMCAASTMWYRNYCEARAQTAEKARDTEKRTRIARLYAPPPEKISPDQIKKLKALQTELEFPWASVFQAVDQTASANIELLEFSPQTSGRKLTLSGKALNHEALVAYLDALREQRIFHTVYLAKRADVTGGPTHAVEFIVEAGIR